MNGRSICLPIMLLFLILGCHSTGTISSQPVSRKVGPQDAMNPQTAFRYAWAIEQLKNAQPRERQRVVWAARSLESADVVPVLLLALSDEDPRVVQDALSAFTNHPHAGRARAQLFMPLLDHPDEGVQKTALWAAMYSGDSSVCDSLADRLSRASGDTRIRLAASLVRLGDARGLDVLLENADDSQLYVYALGEVRDPRVVTKLIELLARGPDSISWAAADGLAKQGDRRAVPSLIKALDDPSYSVVQAAVRALATLGDTRAVEPLLAIVQDANRHFNHRSAAAEAIGELGDVKAMPALIAFGKTCRGCPAIGNALVKLAAHDQQPILHGLLSEDSAERQLCGAVAGRAGLKAAVPHLVRAVQADESELSDDAVVAARALGEIKDRAATDALIAKLKGKRNARWACARALGDIGDPKAIEPLFNGFLTDTEDGCVPGIASEPYLTSLAQFGEPAATAVIRHLDSADGPRQRKLIEALGRIGHRSAVSVLVGYARAAGEYQMPAVRALGRIKSADAVQALIPLLKSGDPRVRVEASRALVEIGGPEATGALFAAFSQAPSEGMASDLAKTKDPRAVPLLCNYLRAAKSDVQRRVAERALGEIGDPEAAPLLAEVLEKHGDSDAAEALAKIGGKRAAEALISVHAVASMRKLAVPVDTP